MKLLREQRKLQSNDEELTFEEDQEPPVQRNKEEELERKRERMRLLCSRRQLNCEATPSFKVGFISSTNHLPLLESYFPLHHLPMLKSYHPLMLKRH